MSRLTPGPASAAVAVVPLRNAPALISQPAVSRTKRTSPAASTGCPAAQSTCSLRRGASRWTTPPIESFRPPARSGWRTLGLVVLRCYLLAAVIVLAVRAIQLALGAG
jgi:hypothetical protein